MIKSLLKAGFARFGARYDYDASYMSEVTDRSTAAGFRLAALSLFSQFRGPEEAVDVWAGAVLASTLDGDCGPCAQLIVDMAIEAQVRTDQLALCIQGAPEDAGDVGLGFQFARAVIEDRQEVAELRNTIEQRFGQTAVVAASFATSSGRVYPVLKRGLGFGQMCSKVRIGTETLTVTHLK
jgi:hypothetical protein